MLNFCWYRFLTFWQYSSSFRVLHGGGLLFQGRKLYFVLGETNPFWGRERTLFEKGQEKKIKEWNTQYALLLFFQGSQTQQYYWFLLLPFLKNKLSNQPLLYVTHLYRITATSSISYLPPLFPLISKCTLAWKMWRGKFYFWALKDSCL